MNEGRSILVLGGTGNIGGAAIRSLLPRGHHVRSMTRNIKSAGAVRLAELGVEVVEGDLEKDFTPAIRSVVFVMKAGTIYKQ